MATNKEAKAVSSPPTEAMVAVRAPIRSGQCVETEGTLLVLGDVHPGAEIRAGRDVIVMGSARGAIAAGLVSGREAQVFAFALRPTLLRLGDLVARAPAAGPSWRPEIARIRDGQIVVEPFTAWLRTKARRKG
ncbi:MAG: septum site-determining protein MinC [Firmicutes bacterium]|nr:septum site-determining protein MinC [Bacillota bacterium]